MKKYGLKSILEYESSHSNESVKLVNEKKNRLIQKIEKSVAEIEFLGNSDNSKTISTVENILRQEEEKLQALLSDGATLATCRSFRRSSTSWMESCKY